MKKSLFLIIVLLPMISWTMEKPEAFENEPTIIQPCYLNDLPYELIVHIASYLFDTSDETPPLKKFLPLIRASKTSKIWYQAIQDPSLFTNEEQRKFLYSISTSQILLAITQQLKKFSENCSRSPIFNKLKEKTSNATKALQEFKRYLNKQLDNNAIARSVGLAGELNAQGIFEKFKTLLNTDINPNIHINDSKELIKAVIRLPQNTITFAKKLDCTCLKDRNLHCNHSFDCDYKIPIQELNNLIKILLKKDTIILQSLFDYYVFDTTIKKEPLIVISIARGSSILQFANQTNDQELKELAIAHGSASETIDQNPSSEAECSEARALLHNIRESLNL